MTYFSVIIPTYNRAHLISETLDSALSQSYPYFEIIIVDDGSTDNTKQVIESRYNNDERVKYYFKQNEERGAARNFGLKQSKGDYAIFFDSDDLMKPCYLTTMAEVIEEKKNIYLLAGHYNFIENNKNETPAPIRYLTNGWYDRNYFLSGNILACNFCIRIKDKSFRLFPEERELASMEDWLFLLLNLEKEKIFIKNEVCLSMRQHHQRSMNNNQQVIGARQKATKWAIENLNLSGPEKKRLIAWSYYFCGVHQYLDHNRATSIRSTIAAIREAGLNKKFLLLLGKSLIGRKIITAIK